MRTIEFITALFVTVDDQLTDQGRNGKHPQGKLYLSEIVTLGLLFALKGVGERPFYRWLEGDYLDLFPQLPTRVRLFRLLKTHHALTDLFLAEPSLLGVIDTYGIELIHPRREGRSPKQIGRKGLSNQRWIVGGKLCILLNNIGLVVGWDCDTANVYAGSMFQELVNGMAGMFPIDLALIAVIIDLGKQGRDEIDGRHGENSYLKVNTEDRDRSALLMTLSRH